MLANIHEYLPSKTFAKRLGFLVLVLALIAGIIVLFNYLKNRRIQNEQAALAPIVSPLIVKDITMIDNNEDGVQDWKQNLAEALGIVPAGESEVDETPINETEQFARDLFATAAAISQSGDVTEDGAQSIAEQVSARIATSTLENLFTEKDIVVVAPTDKNKAAYLDNLIYLLDEKYPLDIDTSVVIAETALSSGDGSGLEALEPIITRYTNLIDAMRRLPVPENVRAGHLEFLNILGQARGSIQIMRNSFANPVPAMSAFINYPYILNALIEYVSPFTEKIPYAKALQQ